MQQPMFVAPMQPMMVVQQPYAMYPVQQPQTMVLQPQAMVQQPQAMVQLPQTMVQPQAMVFPLTRATRQPPQGIQQFQNQAAQAPGSMESKLHDFEHMQQALSTHVTMEPNPTYQCSAAVRGNNDIGMYEIENLDDGGYTPMQPSAQGTPWNGRSDDPPPYVELLRS